VISGVQQCGRSVLGRSKKLRLLSCLTGAQGNIRLGALNGVSVDVRTSSSDAGIPAVHGILLRRLPSVT